MNNPPSQPYNEPAAVDGLTLTVRELRTALRATIPATYRDGDLPVLGCVHLCGGDGLLLATGTDRHILSHVRLPADGKLAPVLVDRHDAELMLRMLANRSDDQQVTLARCGAEPWAALSLSAAAQPYRTRLVILPGPDPQRSWPTHLADLPMPAIGDCTLTMPAGVDPELLERLVGAVRPLAEAQRRRAGVKPHDDGWWMRMYVAERTNTVGQQAPSVIRLEIGDWWLGLIQPASNQLDQAPHVPLTFTTGAGPVEAGGTDA